MDFRENEGRGEQEGENILSRLILPIAIIGSILLSLRYPENALLYLLNLLFLPLTCCVLFYYLGKDEKKWRK